VTFGAPLSPPSAPKAASRPSRQKQFPSSDVGSVECDGAVADAELSSDFLFKVTGSHEFEGEVSSLFDSIEAKQILQVTDDFLILGIVC
jgi:hypothetical protein